MNCPQCQAEVSFNVSANAYACANGHKFVLQASPAAAAPGYSAPRAPTDERAVQTKIQSELGVTDECLRKKGPVPPPPVRSLNPVRQPVNVQVEMECMVRLQQRFQQPAAFFIQDVVRVLSDDAGSFIVTGDDRKDIETALGGGEIASSRALLGKLNYLAEKITEVEKNQPEAKAAAQSTQDVSLVASLAMQLGEMKAQLAQLSAAPPKRTYRKRGDATAKDEGDRLFEKHVGPLAGIRVAKVEPETVADSENGDKGVGGGI